MYIQPEKKKLSPFWRLVIVSALSFLIVAGAKFIQVMVDDQPEWARPFEPSPTPTLPAAYFINSGDIAFAEGNLPQAINAYEQAISRQPDTDLAYRKLAQILVLTGNTARGLIYTEKAVLLNPGSAPNLAGYCQALDWEGQYGPAADACECAMELDPGYAPGYAFLAEVYADQSLWKLAKSTAQQALEVDFQNPEAQHTMGYALEVQGRYAQAAEFYENAITLRPNFAPYYLDAGANYYWMNKLTLSADRFGKAIKLNPTDPTGYDQLGWTFHTDGQDARAIDALEQSISVDPAFARSWGRLGTIYYLRQNYEEAIKLLPVAISLSEKANLRKIRKIEVFTPLESPSGTETVPVLQGRFSRTSDGDAGILTAPISPVRWQQNNPRQETAPTCGHAIARALQTQIILTSPSQTITFSLPFSPTTGMATLNLATAQLTLNLKNVPFPQNIPYEVRLTYRPETTESIGYVQPDGQNTIETQFTITSQSKAPVEYLYELGLSYAYLSPPQCDQAIPWLLAALEIDSSYYNPAWEGLKICPTDASPPTPLPTFTPSPESAK